MTVSLQTRAIDFISLSSKHLVSDLKEASICDVSHVCALACDHCPYVVNNIDTNKVNLSGLSNCSIELIKQKDEHLLLNITAVKLDKWIENNHLKST